MSRIVGIDLAASRKATAYAVLVDGALQHVAVDADDDALLRACDGADKIGIDCPLGWPTAFVEFVTAHAAGRALPATAAEIEQRRRLVYRETDLRVAEQFPPLRPLSVAADRIGHAALRCAGLLERLSETDRSGRGRVVEVYPAASLLVWGLQSRRYKRAAGAPALAELAKALAEHLDLGAFEHLCQTSDHALDAVVAALSALATLHGAATLPEPTDRDVARREGWIAVPTCTLSELSTVRPTGSS